MSELPKDSFFNCDILTDISIKNSKIGRIKRGFARRCIFLQYLLIKSSSVLSISENAFEGLSTLKNLDMPGCDLTCLPPLLFQPLKNLKEINFSGNKISALHSQIFNNLMFVQYAEFGNNRIEYIPKFNLDNFGILNPNADSQISLFNNSIRAIHPNFLTYLFTERQMKNKNHFSLDYSFDENAPCVDPKIQLKYSFIGWGSFYNDNWLPQNLAFEELSTCYSDFNEERGSDRLAICENE